MMQINVWKDTNIKLIFNFDLYDRKMLSKYIPKEYHKYIDQLFEFRSWVDKLNIIERDNNFYFYGFPKKVIFGGNYTMDDIKDASNSEVIMLSVDKNRKLDDVIKENCKLIEDNIINYFKAFKYDENVIKDFFIYQYNNICYTTDVDVFRTFFIGLVYDMKTFLRHHIRS